MSSRKRRGVQKNVFKEEEHDKIPEKILDATDVSGQVVFLMKWKDIDVTELVPAEEANLKWPQIVIKFYEERLVWIYEP